MEKTTTTRAFEIGSATGQSKEKPQLIPAVSKEQVISLLKTHAVADTHILEEPAVRTEDVIPTLRKAKVEVPEAFFRDLASEVHLSFLSKAEFKQHCRASPHCKVVSVLPYRVLEEYLIVPLQITETDAQLVLSNPFNRKAMMVIQVLLGKRKVTWHLASSESVDMAIEKVYSEIHKQSALMDLYYRNPDESAHQVLFPSQKYWIIGVLLAITAAAVVSSVLTFAVLFAVINIAYFVINPIKIYISFRGFQRSNNVTEFKYFKKFCSKNRFVKPKIMSCPSTPFWFPCIMKPRFCRR